MLGRGALSSGATSVGSELVLPQLFRVFGYIGLLQLNIEHPLAQEPYTCPIFLQSVCNSAKGTQYTTVTTRTIENGSKQGRYTCSVCFQA